MAENLILPFAQGQGANVLSQTDYAGDSMRLQGHQPGVARSALENKVLRQCSAVASGVAEFIASRQSSNITDSNTPREIAVMLAKSVFPDAGMAPNGYISLANDTSVPLLIEWGTKHVNVDPAAERGSGTVTLPLAFTTQSYIALITPYKNFTDATVANTGGVVCSVHSTTETGFTFQFFPNDKTVNVRGDHYFKWISIGA